MPFRSEAQRRLMWARHPEIAKRWADEQKRKGEPQVIPLEHVKRALKGKKRA